ncbi:hypothetical protein [Amycolatopsis magusensis]|uniref:hypothetical protein n=1 Tax=Amycolatopsis magusensis TaxID=882444 RepID=UPI0037B05F9C
MAMAWEWLAPTATVVGASITAGFGGWLGGRQSRRNQERQHQFEREKALTDRGKDRIDQAAVALRFLSQRAGTVARWTGHEPRPGKGHGERAEDEPTDFSEQHDQIGQAIPYILDEQVRRDIELVHHLIHRAFDMRFYISGEVPPAVEIITVACREGLLVLGRYLRQEPWEPSAELAPLRKMNDEAEAEAAEQNRQDKAYREDMRERAAEQRRQPPSQQSAAAD